ncbi:DUF6042 family protein [Actinoplanes sichuanensis]|uniref:DUF6042 family protein n=1 Tax=Actinoplanes sichuanensis TaxID=512349 RepID=A0ABW4AV90_9ACTN|nr:DUF6042 family protein [Actinoplanes sichuanensis]
MRVFEIDGYDPEYRTLAVRDPAGYEPAGPGDLDEPVGTFAGAGVGWLAAVTNGRSGTVRLEAHDTRPPADGPVIDDELETPYRSSTGRLSLTAMTAGGGGRSVLELGGNGDYRVRVARTDSDRMLLQFWPDPSPVPPVWRLRSRPAVGGGMNGWRNVLPAPIMNIRRVVGAVINALGRPVSVADIDEWTRTHRHPSDRLDAPLWPTRPGPATYPTGMQRRVDDIAAELGVPLVRDRPDVLPLLTAAGLLVRDDTDRYGIGRPKRVDTVLSMPPEQARMVREADARSRYQPLAEDVLAVVRWTPGAQLETTTAELARRLLATETQVREVLDYGERTGVLRPPSGMMMINSTMVTVRNVDAW